jgi:fatty-acyl-CoA synthase
LGFLDDEGFLYITGRLKDLIILGGRNLLPADVEEVVDQIPGIRYSAAVGIESERTGSQRLYVVAEVRDPSAPPQAGWPALTREIVHRVHRAVGHRPGRVLLVAPSTIPKTSSGKIQRVRLGELIRAGALRDRIVNGDGAGG